MAERQITPETEQAIAIVDEWVNNLTEHSVVKELDRGVLRTALEACGAHFELEDSERERLSRTHYASSTRRKTISKIWGDKYDEFVSWTKDYIANSEQEGDKVAKLENTKIKHLGHTGFLEELTTYAATDDESYSFVDFYLRMTARAQNGYVRYVLGEKKKEFRQHIIIPEYNTIHYEFIGQEGDWREGEMPLAPAGFPPQHAKDGWNKLKTP
jgi:hypothetical protein